VSPGSVATPLFKRVAPGHEADLEPEDVARVIAFLCSPDAGVANGSNLIVWGK
jgi:NAD(P)-dependent dehydrogenase (short-subunit alcohol dehydrogenase family)